MSKAPHWTKLVEWGYMPAYFDPESPDLAKAYNQLKASNPDAYNELFRFDRQQASRDLVYEMRTVSGQGNDIYDPNDNESLSHLFPNTLHGQLLTRVANMLIAKCSQDVIALELNLSQSTVSRLVDKIRETLRPGTGERNGVPG